MLGTYKHSSIITPIANKRNPKFLLITLALLSLSLLASFGAAVSPSGFWALIAFLCYSFFCITLFLIKAPSFLLLSPLLFLRLTEMLSGIAIEYGAFITELGIYGEPTGAMTRLSALYIFFFYLASLVTDRGWVLWQTPLRLLPERIHQLHGYSLFVIILAFLLISVLQVGLQHGFPLLDAIDRFHYRFAVNNLFFISFMNNRFLIVAVLGLFIIDQNRRKLSILLLISIFIVSILYGEKFTSLSIMSILAFIPAGLVHLSKGKKLSFKLLLGLPCLMAILTIPLILIAYGATQNLDLAIERMLNRATAQAQLWWVADRDHLTLFALQAEPLLADIATWMIPSAQDAVAVGDRFGLYMVMRHYAPADIYQVASTQGTGYIFALFAYLLMITGLVGLLIIGSAAHLLYAITMVWLLRAVAEGDWIRSLIVAKLFNSIISGGFIIGYLWSFFGIKPLIFIIAIIILQRFPIPFFTLKR